jgi:hypothetical protein
VYKVLNIISSTLLLYWRLYPADLYDKLYIQLLTVQLAKTLPKPEGKIKTTWLLPKDLVKKVKQYALDNDTNSTAVFIKPLESFCLVIKNRNLRND